MTIEINNESAMPTTEATLHDLASFVLTELHVHPDTDLAILLVDEDAMTKLHEQWMGEPGPTDVLSFPMDELRPGRPDAQTPAGLLGDIVVCPQVAAIQADAAGHDLMTEMLVLVTHGMLHLLGYDHAEPVEEHEMFSLQNQLLQSYLLRGAGA
ncbi:rRNA maturation RNase YbeY [Leucobacter chinensis]|uniref:rRNA maturation RNase YbeY n=1 Tax=Leucobacter chinensis TaxID=2851010 RepID=UPI001C224F26